MDIGGSKALAERTLSAEMEYHLSDEVEAENSRNFYGRKSVSTGTGKIEIAVRRDRASSFDPQLIAKYQRRFPGFDDKIVSMYARDISIREITAIFSETIVQTCIVHLLRNSMFLVSCKNRNAVATALKDI